MEKSADAFRTISEVADELDLPQHVLRFWETRFPSIKPMKRAGGRRFYRRDDVDLLRAIRHLLYADGYTIKGVQRLLKERGVRSVMALPGQAILPEYSAQVLGPDSDTPEAAAQPDEEDEVALHAMALGQIRDEPADPERGLRPAEPHSFTRVATGSAIQPRGTQGGSVPLHGQIAGPASEGAPATFSGGVHLPLDLEQKLQAALFELAECERILAAALQSAI